MTEKIIQLIQENWKAFPLATQQAMPKKPILLSKFYHGRASNSSKVLFLATCGKKPLCIIKTVRDASANEKLKKEKESQEKFAESSAFFAPRVYFDGLINSWYLYAEEIILGRPLSEKTAHQKESEIISAICSLFVSKNILATSVAKIFLENIPLDDAIAVNLIRELNRQEIIFKKGFGHGDLTRKNIISSKGSLRVIDWERAGDRPFWLLDGVHFMVSLRNIKSKKEWEKEAASLFIRYTNTEAALANALYCFETVLEIFCKKYPQKYTEVINQLAQLED